MFLNSNINMQPSTIVNNDEHVTEKVYVDWPEESSDDYRFVSSRMEDIESDYNPLLNTDDIKRGIDVTGNLSDLRVANKPPIHDKTNKRYEDLSRRHPNRPNNSSIPPLDLISQHSSIEIPGAKGAIDIDFRSTSDSMSEEYDDKEANLDVERDSLDENHDNYDPRDNDIYNTKLPRVAHEELVINPGEYNSSRYSQNNVVSRRLSDITIPSQYRNVAPIKPNYSHYESANHNGKESEQAAFENVQLKYKQNFSSTSHEHTTSTKNEMSPANSATKLQKSKPTLQVAPQIKQSLNERSPNFIELNKATLNQQKQVNQTSYANKFADRQRKDSPSRIAKKSAPAKDIPLPVHNYPERVDRNPPLSSQDYWSKRERSIERLTGDHREYREHKEDNLEAQIPRPIYPATNSNVVYAFTQYGDPVMMPTNEAALPINYARVQERSSYTNVHQQGPEYYPQVNIVNHNSVAALTSPRVQRSTHYVQEMRRSVDSDHVFQDPPFKRQPTLYDEKLLEKKTRIVSSERLGSHLPPLPGSSDSSASQNMGTSYSANLRKKEANYEQYTLRDFKNIKQINSVGGLGPNVGTESHKQMKDKLMRQKNYSKAVKEKNQELLKSREKENRDNPSSAVKVEDISYRDNVDVAQNDVCVQTNESESHEEEKAERTTVKSTLPSTNSAKGREQAAKRDVMINYAKTIKEKQLKKQISKTKVGGSQSDVSKKDNDNPKIAHELFNNSDLEKLLQRHEYDKRMTDQIRQKYEKIN